MNPETEVANPHHHHLVLIHGVGHGAWCWYKLRCLLEASGHKVTCMDLKGAGIDQSDPNTILTFEDYNKPLINFLSTLPHDEKVILVGHSAGGMSLTDAIHRFGNKIHMAIYVAATMLKYGFSTDQDFIDGEPDLSAFGNVNEFIFGFGPDQPPTSVIMKEDFRHQILYHMSPIQDSSLASMLLRPGPVMALQGARFKGNGDEVDCVPRVYIKTMKDRVLKPEQQDAMIKRWPPFQVFVLDSDHSPFFSTPFSLFDLLLKASASIKYYYS
ncbi:PREDICTED: methylesterase 17-like [Fragaria vesca subsp. vesca]|uniref:methylesterase 17-like n=1 Tax=Fragaria vesca subsp. vesca TaxID=101020 RepID=UPI0002C33B01|nr:PREDICTED: methylesterase 17-like [Fragaria vesca subsp. vesca]